MVKNTAKLLFLYCLNFLYFQCFQFHMFCISLKYQNLLVLFYLKLLWYSSIFNNSYFFHEDLFVTVQDVTPNCLWPFKISTTILC